LCVCVCFFEIERFGLLIIVFCGDNKRQQWFVLCFLIWKKRVHDIFFPTNKINTRFFCASLGLLLNFATSYV
jgi:capsule polysaccharide export protein KpsC/LpsZ